MPMNPLPPKIPPTIASNTAVTSRPVRATDPIWARAQSANRARMAGTSKSGVSL